MNLRNSFMNELTDLKKEITYLGSMIEQGFVETVKAISNKDITKLEEIIDRDKEINRLELDINEKATLMIAKQQPVASDLRKIISSLKVSSDLERMGDLTVDMAKSAIRIGKTNTLERYEKKLIDMADQTQSMIREVMKAYESSNTIEAQHIASLDDRVDDAYGDFIKSVFESNRNGQEIIDLEITMQMVFISRFIERIADYCTNIAEWIVYEVNGEHFDLN